MGKELDLDDVAAQSPLAMKELMEMRRWISTNKPRLHAIEALYRESCYKLHGARESIFSLASERAANSILTEEVERLTKILEELVKNRE